MANTTTIFDKNFEWWTDSDGSAVGTSGYCRDEIFKDNGYTQDLVCLNKNIITLDSQCDMKDELTVQNPYIEAMVKEQDMYKILKSVITKKYAVVFQSPALNYRNKIANELCKSHERLTDGQCKDIITLTIYKGKGYNGGHYYNGISYFTNFHCGSKSMPEQYDHCKNLCADRFKCQFDSEPVLMFLVGIQGLNTSHEMMSDLCGVLET